jgi:hypothetical protein
MAAVLCASEESGPLPKPNLARESGHRIPGEPTRPHGRTPAKNAPASRTGLAGAVSRPPALAAISAAFVTPLENSPNCTAVFQRKQPPTAPCLTSLEALALLIPPALLLGRRARSCPFPAVPVHWGRPGGRRGVRRVRRCAGSHRGQPTIDRVTTALSFRHELR